jgi:group I intron endonuclease
MRFVYFITNKINGLQYVGQTKNLKRRWYSLCCNNNNQAITKAIQEYGKENFKMELLEECSSEIIDEREKYWIDKLNTFKGPGYNEHVGGRTLGRGKEHPRTGKKTPEEIKEKMRQTLKENGTLELRQGKNHYLYGKKRSKNYLQKVSGMNHFRAKINSKKAIQIIKKYFENGITQNELSKIYGVHHATINRIINLTHWTMKDLNKPKIS